MKKHIIILAVLVMSAPIVNAMDIGVLGSLWNQKDEDDVMGAGVLLLPATVPLELRGTYYERSSPRNVRAIPIDFGLNLQLTRTTSVLITAVGGGSYYFIDRSGGSSDNEFGWYLGGRLEVPASGYKLFGEVFYRGADFDDPNIDLSGWTFNIGILF